ncbi:MAG: glycoside hydrolase family 2, partial [Acidobacteriota bacterium]
NDVAFVTATVVDQNGVIVLDANPLIKFSSTGPGDIVAVDSADNADHDPFQAKQRKAFQGTCLALIKTKASSGKIVVTATAADLKSSTITITVVPNTLPRPARE